MSSLWLPLNGDLHNQGISGIIATGTNISVNTAGKIGSCYSFNGSSSYIELNSALCSNETTEFSYTCWIKFNSTACCCLFSNRTATNSNGVTLFVNNSGNILYDIGNGRHTKTYAFSTGTWYHLAFTYKKGATKKIYVNGAEIYSASTSDTMTGAAATKSFIGASQNTSTTVNANYLNGYLNDVRVWNDHCLSAAEVKEIALGLVLHYKLDEGNENLLLDAPKSYSATAYNAYQFDMKENLVAGQTYTIQLWDVTVEHSAKTAALMNLQVYWGGGNVRLHNFNGSTNFTILRDHYAYSPYLCAQITPTEANASGSGATNKWLNIYNSVSNADGTRNMEIGAWKLEKGSSATLWISSDADITKILDSSGYNHNGAIVGSAVSAADTARYDVSTHIDGVGVIAATTPGADIRTLSCWVKTTKNKSTSQMLVADSASNMCISFYAGTIIGVFGTTRSTGSKCTLGASYKENDWNHIVVVKTSDDGQRGIYCNGEKLTPAANDYWSATAGFFVGNRNGTVSGNTPFFGYISDVRAYCTPLLDTDIKLLYNVSMKIDKSSKIHSFEVFENGLNKITKQGQLKCANIIEFDGLSYLKYDSNLYIEPDGSCWVRIFHHNNPAEALFASTDDFAHSVYKDENRWFNVELCNYLNLWELLVRSKRTADDTEVVYRWVLNANPMTATAAQVTADLVTYNTNGYNTRSWGGIYKRATADYTYLNTHNGTAGNWYGAIGGYSLWNGGTTGLRTTGAANAITTGYVDLYVRIDNLSTTFPSNVKSTKNNLWLTSNIIER